MMIYQKVIVGCRHMSLDDPDEIMMTKRSTKISIAIVRDGALGQIRAIEDSLQAWSIEHSLNILWTKYALVLLFANHQM
jgi:hypothetical protein